MPPYESKFKCNPCCDLWKGIAAIGIWTVFEFFGLVAMYLYCAPYDACTGRDYGAWLLHLFLCTNFLILLASNGNQASRKLLRNAIVLETVIIFWWTTIGAIVWFPTD